MEKKKEYIKVVSHERPFSDYPAKLAKYLAIRYDIPAGAKLLDVGCGRGEFTMGFRALGIAAEGTDISVFAHELFPDLTIHQVDLENPPFDLPDDTYDVVYSKSVIGHFYYPERIMVELLRILKPGGLMILMVPDWWANRRWFFDGFTQRTPFTPKSVRVMMELTHFEDIKVEKIRQLPSAWRFPILNVLYRAIATVTPRLTSSKLLRFSKELMVLGTGRKPTSSESVKP